MKRWLSAQLVLGTVLWTAWSPSGFARASQAAPPPQEKPAAPAPAPTPAPQAPRGGGAPPSDDAFRFGSPPSLPAGTTQEEMWPAATAEGWAKPCLVPWQRSIEDALAISKATGAPILVCVNMDG